MRPVPQPAGPAETTAAVTAARPAAQYDHPKHDRHGFPAEGHRAPPSPRPLWLALPAAVLVLAAVLNWCTLPVSGVSVPALRLSGWLAVIVATVIGAALSRVFAPPSMALTGVLATLLAALLGNWAAIAPHGYFAMHRLAFSQVAQFVRAGHPASAAGAGTESLPALWRPLSATGKAVVVGRNGDRAAVLLPQNPPPGDGTGFVYLYGAAPGTLILDLPGGPVRLVDGTYLGNGWWWV